MSLHLSVYICRSAIFRAHNHWQSGHLVARNHLFVAISYAVWITCEVRPLHSTTLHDVTAAGARSASLDAELEFFAGCVLGRVHINFGHAPLQDKPAAS